MSANTELHDPRPTGGPAAGPAVSASVLELVFRAPDGLGLRYYPGSALRGALGRALRYLSCTAGRETCSDCPRRDGCPYGVVWEPAPKEHLPKRHRTPPPPYVVEPPFLGRPLSLRPGGRFGVRLKLFGPARAFEPQLIAAARLLATGGLGPERAPLGLERVVRVEPPGFAESVLYSHSHGMEWSPGEPWWIAPHAIGDAAWVRLVCLTPLALHGGGGGFDPEVFTARLCDRLDVMSLGWEHRPERSDFFLLRELARDVEVLSARLRSVSFERVSARPSPERHGHGSDPAPSSRSAMLRDEGAHPGRGTSGGPQGRDPGGRLSRGDGGRRRAHGPSEGGNRIRVEGVVGEVRLGRVPGPLAGLWQCAEFLHVGGDTMMGFGSVRVDFTPDVPLPVDPEDDAECWMW